MHDRSALSFRKEMPNARGRRGPLERLHSSSEFGGSLITERKKIVGSNRCVATRPLPGIIAARLLIGILAGLHVSTQAVLADEISPKSETSGAASAREGELFVPPADTMPLIPLGPRLAKLGGESASDDVRGMVDWIVGSSDNRSLPFVVVDKTDAKVFVFDHDGKLLGAAPALLGLAVGDDSVAGIGERKLSGIRPDERTTPAGRFVAALGKNLHKQDILWIDYATAISLHAVVTTNRAERRLQRLETASPLDNRISYGCINVPAAFYKTVVSPTFTGTDGIVYILPETRSIREVFAVYDAG